MHFRSPAVITLLALSIFSPWSRFLAGYQGSGMSMSAADSWGFHCLFATFPSPFLESQNHLGWRSPRRSLSPNVLPALPRPPPAMSPSATSTGLLNAPRAGGSTTFCEEISLKIPSFHPVIPLSHGTCFSHPTPLFPLATYDLH